MRLMKDWKSKMNNLMEYWGKGRKNSLNMISFPSNVRNLIVLRVWDRKSAINFMGFIAHMYELTREGEVIKNESLLNLKHGEKFQVEFRTEYSALKWMEDKTSWKLTDKLKKLGFKICLTNGLKMILWVHYCIGKCTIWRSIEFWWF